MPNPSPNPGEWSSEEDRGHRGFLPLAVDILHQLCVVVGCGRVAERKVRKLLEYGARVRLVLGRSPRSTGHDELVLPDVEVVGRECRAEDVVNARLVIAASSEPDENQRVARIARDAGALVLLADAPEESDFHLPAVLRQGDLSISFSTNGASPGFAARLRDEARVHYGAAHGEFCRLARWLRCEARSSVPADAREKLFARLVESDVLELLMRGQHAEAVSRVRQLRHEAQATVAVADDARKRAFDGPAGQSASLGKVYLVGAGPGDPELLTLKGKRCLGLADTILHDGMVSERILHACPPGAKRLNVGKRKGRCESTQTDINATLIREAQLGRTVVRLKGGDPLVFGRGGEEARALRAAGIPFEIVPGVSSAIAVPAYAGIPVTDRELSSSFAVYSAHRQGGLCHSDAEWKRIADGPDTLVILMGKSRCEHVAQKLVDFGRPASTPVALIFDGTTCKQTTVVGTLGSIAARTRDLEIPGPGLIVIGEVVNAVPIMSWFHPAGLQELLERDEPCLVG